MHIDFFLNIEKKTFYFITGLYLLLLLEKRKITLSRASALAKTMNAKPLDLPVLGSVLTLILSMSPYVLKCSLNSSEKSRNKLQIKISRFAEET